MAKQVLGLYLGSGEAEAIILGRELAADYVILDERIAREIASQIGLKVIGLLGILVKAKEKEIVSQVKPLIEALRRERFRVSENLVNEVLKMVGEGF
ncbi:MAG: DUF3368 domain-containing protein [bacterium]|nr:DUF3368 domain-containing protein [bacterium]